jgi:opacity protein-like surface antigen
MKGRALIVMAVVIIVAVMLIPMPAPAAATPEEKGTQAWQFEFTPYLFAAGMNGKTGMNRVTADIDAGFNDIFNNLDTEQIYQLSAGYRVADDRVKVDLIAAARTTLLDAQLNLTVTTGSPLLPDGSRGTSFSESWWDPVIGVRALMPLAEKWTAVGYADIGGFGVGSDLTYQLLAGVNWQFAKSVSAKLGYRYLYQDYENNGFIWDMTSSGFYLGAGFRF